MESCAPPSAPPIDVEALKIVSDNGASYESGWNDCIDRLASTGRLNTVLQEGSDETA